MKSNICISTFLLLTLLNIGCRVVNESAEIWISYTHADNDNFEAYIGCLEWIDENVYGGALRSADKQLRSKYDL